MVLIEADEALTPRAIEAVAVVCGEQGRSIQEYGDFVAVAEVKRNSCCARRRERQLREHRRAFPALGAGDVAQENEETRTLGLEFLPAGDGG